MATHNTASWSATWSGYTRSFRGWMDYTTSITETTYTITITSYGYEKIPSGKTTFEQSTGSVVISGAINHSTSRNFKNNPITYAQTANSRIAIWSGSYAVSFNRTTSQQTKTATLTAKKDSSVWAGSGTAPLSLTIPAKNQYTVTAYGNNGSTSAATGWTISGNNGTNKQYYGTSITLPSASRTGYTFLGWSTASNATTATYGAGASFTVTANVSLYAVWKINTYTLTANASSGSIPTTSGWSGTGATATKSLNYGSQYGTLPSPTRTGYTFAGWYTAATGGTAISTSNTITGNTSIYAHWTANTYTLTINPQSGTYGGTTSNSTKTMTYNSTTNNSIGTPSRAGYTFGGWYTSTGGGGTQIFTSSGGYNSAATSYWSSSGAWIYTGALTVYAKWTIINYSISYSLNNGSATNPASYTITSAAIKLNNPIRNGYTFTGWTGSNGSTAQTSVTIPAGSTGNKSYTANWSVITYKITYNLNSGSATNPSTYTVASNAITLNNPAKTGYNFTGWTGSNGNTAQTSVTIPSGSTGDKSYTANWTAQTTTVSLNANNGSGGTTSVTATYNANMPSATMPTRTGYTFNGYYDQSSGGTQYYTSSGASARVWNKANTSSTILYAQWTANKYTVNFNVLYGSYGATVSPTSMQVTYGTAYGTLPRPSWSNHTFNGWYTASSGGSQITASSTVSITAAQTLYARWTGNQVVPAFVKTAAERCTETGAYDAEQNYCRVTIQANKGYYYSNNSNSTTICNTTLTINYKVTTASSWTSNAYLRKVVFSNNGTPSWSGSATQSPTITTDETTYVITNNSGIPIDFNIQNSFDIEFVLTSANISNVNRSTIPLSAAYFPIDVNEDGTAIGLFRVAPDAGQGEGLYVGKKAVFDYSVTLNATINNYAKQLNIFNLSGTNASIDSATIGNLVVNGNISAVNGINNFIINTNASGLNADNVRTSNGIWLSTSAITNAATANWGALFNDSRGTPYQLFIPDSTNMYIYKRYYSNNAWSAWSKLSAGYADSAGSAGSVSEANLNWGGKNFAGDFGPVDAGLLGDLGTNRFMFAKDAGITIEYSRDGGSNWTNYGTTGADKTSLFGTGSTAYNIGKHDSTNKATANTDKYQLRVTLDTGNAQIYSAINKFAIYVSTNGSSNSTVTIQKATQGAPTNYTNVATNIPLSGWSGWNIINTETITTYGNNTSQYGRLRFIFKANGGNTTYNGLTIYRICGFGGVGWTTPSNMAKTGHLYSYDNSQKAYFPASVAATTFDGGISYTTTAPTSNNTSGLKFVVLSSDPATKYSGWVYLITG